MRRSGMVLFLAFAGLAATAVTGAFFLWHLHRIHSEATLASQSFDAVTLDTRDPLKLLAKANHLSWLFNSPAAGPLYARAEVLFRQAGDPGNELYAKIGRIRSQAETMSFVDISNYLGTELNTPLVQNDPQLKLWCLVAKGYTDIEVNIAAAKADWTDARELANRLGEKQWAARADGELGLIAFLQGDARKGARLVGGALLSAMASGDVGGQVRYLELIGNGFNEMKRWEEASYFFDRAISLAADTRDAGFPFMAHEGKAYDLMELNKPREAGVLLDVALRTARQQHKQGHESQILILMGDLSLQQRNQAGAIQYWNDAAGIASQFKYYRIVMDATFKLADLYRQEGDLHKAEGCLQAGLTAGRQVGDKYYVPRNLSALAAVKAQEGESEAADALYEEAEDVIDGILVNAPGSYSKSSLTNAMGDTYLAHFELAAKLHDVTRAFEVLERVRGRTTADVLRDRSSLESNQSPSAASAEGAISVLQTRLMRSEDRGVRKQLLDELFVQEQHLAYAHEDPSTSPPTPLPQNARLDFVQRVLEPDELVLEYVLANPNAFCLSISRQRAEITVLPAGGKQIEDLVDQYLSRINEQKSDSGLARQLYSFLIQPVTGVAEKSRLVIVPDGKLHLLPFAALQDGRGQYLLYSFATTYAPSANVLAALRAEHPRQPPTRAFLGVGGVPYEKNGPLIASLGKPGSITERVLRGLYDLGGAKLENLPETREEIVSAAHEIGDAHSVTLLGPRATETAFKAEPLADFRIIHLAVHAVSDPQYPERSALILGRDEHSQDDGLLQQREIKNLPLGADLVTLSACDTGIGRLQGEEGVTSLVESFLFAGARAVVASLWSSDDSFTEALMARFYRHLAQEENKAEALRNAKIDLLKEYGSGTSPFYWAGFVMVGDGSSAIPMDRP